MLRENNATLEQGCMHTEHQRQDLCRQDLGALCEHIDLPACIYLGCILPSASNLLVGLCDYRTIPSPVEKTRPGSAPLAEGLRGIMCAVLCWACVCQSRMICKAQMGP
jgi:hypothetical protein